ncbi:hypothetical protein LCGC14_2315630 [marine sediment metagenome]|uniref:Phosphoadenosine phosphosulphate reductase domain-containing protein n=1 Tax=marine sediment metagenome TaxID=412755 RepID=A0A0F9CJF0_9ZZZZ
MIDYATLQFRQALPLWMKVEYTKKRIRDWYDSYNGDVYIAFSGGKDSTVLLHIVRSLYPYVPAVFVDTGLEYPEIREFVRGVDNVVWLCPMKTFKQVIERYGYPVISKKVSMGLDRYRNTKSPKQRHLRLYGGVNPTSGKKQYRTIPKKWHFLTGAPFDCSDRCCAILKKAPFVKYEKLTGNKPFIGTMACDSNVRQQDYLKSGCNAYSNNKPRSTPMAFWLEQDVWDYIDQNDVSYSDIYKMGYRRTGCMFCMFGVNREAEPNRFQMMERTHPAQYTYCMDRLGLRRVLGFLGVSVTTEIRE